MTDEHVFAVKSEIVIEHFKTQSKMMIATLVPQSQADGSVRAIGQVCAEPIKSKPGWNQLFEVACAANNPKVGSLIGEPGILPGIGKSPAGIAVQDELLSEINRLLNRPSSDVRRISSLPIERTFVYVDISDFSRNTPILQALIINSMIDLVRLHGGDRIEARMCIGDGYIYVFEESWRAALFGTLLARAIQGNVALGNVPETFHFRIGIHCGEVFCFWDFDPFSKTGRWNYIGDGINGGQRVMAAMGKSLDDAIFISGQVADRLRAETAEKYVAKTILAALENKGRHEDKHKNPWRIYQIDHDKIPENMLSALGMPD
ncbi:MAG TPA: adenylate/guanylate cyclase domain-containing protein [Planctomycetota bacterium]|nr:adenylate/guanylate cyclase domain-containing protein [Planctomycetota bacterium]